MINEQKIQKLLFWTLFAIGVFICGFKVFNITYQSLWMDECFNIIAADMIREHMVPRYPSGYMYYKAIFCSYIFALIAAIFGDSVFVYRFFSVILHFLNPILVFRLTKGYLKKEVLFVAGLMYYLHPWGTEYARTALYHPLLQFMVTVSLMIFIGNVFFNYKLRYEIPYLIGGLTHQLGFGLAFSWVALLITSPKKFFSRKILIWLPFWILFFIFIIVQEALFWKVGYVFQYDGSNGIQSIIDFFIKSTPLLSLRLLRRSHYVSFYLFFIGFSLMILKLIYLKIIRKKLDSGENVLMFLMVFFILAVTSLSFLDTHHSPRYIYPFHYIFILIIVSLLFNFAMFPLKLLERILKFSKTTFFKVALLSVLSFFIVDQVGIRNNIEIVFRDYDHAVKTDLITASLRIHPYDHERVGEYVKWHMRDDDIIIAMHHLFQYIYVGKVDYWLWSGPRGTWFASEEVDGVIQEVYLGIPIISTAEQLDSVIKQILDDGRRVWLITSPSEREPAHINSEIRQYIGQFGYNIRWISRDGISKVFLLDKDMELPDRFLFQAEWGIFNEDNLNIFEEQYIKIDINNSYKTGLLFTDFDERLTRLKFKEKSPHTKIEMLFFYFGEETDSLTFTLDDDYADIFLKFKKRGRGSFMLRVLEGGPVYFDYFEISPG